MHRVTMQPGHALYAKCPTCKQLLSVHSNPNKAPVMVAFNHPKQNVQALCSGCAKEFSWSPEELHSAKIPD